MPKQLRDRRFGVYECRIVDGIVVKTGPRYVFGGYIGVITQDYIHGSLIPELERLQRSGKFEYPVVVVSWLLRRGEFREPPAPTTRLDKRNLARKGLRELRKMVGWPASRMKDPRTEVWEAVIDLTGAVYRLEGYKIAGPMM